MAVSGRFQVTKVASSPIERTLHTPYPTLTSRQIAAFPAFLAGSLPRESSVYAWSPPPLSRLGAPAGDARTSQYGYGHKTYPAAANPVMLRSVGHGE